MLQDMFTLRNATLAARQRTGDETIGTTVSAGKVQIVRVTFNAKGRSTVAPATDWLTVAEAVQALEAL